MKRSASLARSAPASRNGRGGDLLLASWAVFEALTGLGLIAMPDRLGTALLGRPPGLGAAMIGRVMGAAFVALGIAGSGARADRGSAAGLATMRAATAYNVGAGLLLVLYGVLGQARGPVVWTAGLVHLGFAGAFAAALRSTAELDADHE